MDVASLGIEAPRVSIGTGDKRVRAPDGYEKQQPDGIEKINEGLGSMTSDEFSNKMKKYDRNKNNSGVAESGDPFGDLLILYVEKDRPADLPITGK